MEKVILDCDNTLGVKKSDVDDGLTFAYLYAHPEVKVLGITCTFANNYEHVVYYNTVQMLEDLEIADVPVLKGGRNPEEYQSDAVDFLVDQVNKYPGEINVLAIGSMCNIAGAYHKDPEFFEKIKRLIVMGGVTEPLYLNGVHCKELNFASDPVSAGDVIYNCEKLSLLTGQCTQDAVYGLDDLEKMTQKDTKFMRFCKPILSDWIERKTHDYGDRPVFINWDLCTAIYLTDPELFDTEDVQVVKNYENMKTGLVERDIKCQLSQEKVNKVDVPIRINDIHAFNKRFYEILSNME